MCQLTQRELLRHGGAVAIGGAALAAYREIGHRAYFS
jgi:hypothetical protein